MSAETRPPVCDYEGSDYQERFWEQGGRAYEDGAEAAALRRLLPKGGRLLLEVGAGAGRNTRRYEGFERIVLMDYSATQLQQAQARLGRGEKYIYVAADVYRLPFASGLFDAATMIRVLHHMAEPEKALAEVRAALAPGAVFILEFANKLNLKAILRYLLRRQTWSPFSEEPVEFMALNFDFHPRAVRRYLGAAGFAVGRILTVSHFRIGLVKRLLPTRLLVWLDSLASLTGPLWQFSPSVFVRATAAGDTPQAAAGSFFKCPECGQALLEEKSGVLICSNGHRWALRDGIYNFKEMAG
ncbi:MAG: class I SAM-dependent methyltransferase [Chloroflexi bacterium]|nr:class I SAM-dependent methyltransferase [Chloroflexota bacterium]